MIESGYWNFLKPKVIGHWSRVESPISAGLPDCYVRAQGIHWWVELKNLKSFEKNLGVSGIQQHWHEQNWEMGLTSFVSVRINTQILIIPGGEFGLDKTDHYGASEWLSRSIYTAKVGKTFCGAEFTDVMHKIAFGRLSTYVEAKNKQFCQDAAI